MSDHFTHALLVTGMVLGAAGLSGPVLAQPAGHAQHHGAATPAATPASAPASSSATAAAASEPARQAGAGGYRSAFDGYRRFGEQPLQSWREANDAVGRIGGWQAYAREAQGQPASAPAAPASAAQPGGHAGHR